MQTDTFTMYQQNLDSPEIIDLIKEHFSIYDDSQIRIKLKYALKSKNERNRLIDKLGLDLKDTFGAIYSAFPDVFTKRLLTSLRKQLSPDTIKRKNRRRNDKSRRNIQRVAPTDFVLQTWILSQICPKFRCGEDEKRMDILREIC